MTGRQVGGGDSVPSQPQVTPEAVAHTTVEHSFVLQGVLELNRTVGGLASDVRALRERIDTTATAIEGASKSAQASAKAMQDKIDNLVSWRNTIVAGTAVVVAIVLAICGGLVFVIDKFASRVTIAMPAGLQQGDPASAPGSTAPRK